MDAQIQLKVDENWRRAVPVLQQDRQRRAGPLAERAQSQF